MADESVVQEPAPVGGPWQADIEQNFEDPAVRATVDAFLRSKIQPRMTQLEQQIAGTENARQLWEAFQADPAVAYANITRELWGDELAEAAFAAMEAKQQPVQEPLQSAPEVAHNEAPPAAPATDPRYEEMYDAWKQQQELAAYDAQIEAICGAPENADIDPNLIHTFVAAAEGDFNEAILRYRDFAGQFLARYGVTPGEAAAEQATAPPVMGQGAGGAGAAPPVQKTYQGQQGLYDAIDDAVATMRQNRQ